MKGLEDIIGLSVVHPTWQRTKPNDPKDVHEGWVFVENGVSLSNSLGYGSHVFDDLIPDSNYGVKTIRDLYEISDLDYAKTLSR